MPIAARLFVRTVWLQAAVMAFASSGLAGLLWSFAPLTYTALEWGPYDTWLQVRRQPAAGPDVLLVVRDAASDRQLGGGVWDRSLSARLIIALHDAGASAIGLDIPLNLPSPPHQGGAVSDALLIEAVKTTGMVAYPALQIPMPDQDPSLTPDPTSLVIPGKSIITPSADPDHVVRRARLLYREEGGDLPALGLRLAALRNPTAFTRPEEKLPLDGQGRLLIDFVGPHPTTAFHTVAVHDLLRLVEQKDAEGLAALANGKVIFLFTQPRSQADSLTPSGDMVSDLLLQAHLFHTLISEKWIRELSPLQRWVITLFLSGCIAWLVLRRPDWRGLLSGAAALWMYLTSSLALLAGSHWVFPFIIPVTAAVLVLVAANLLAQVMAGRRVALLEQDMLQIQQDLISVREALVYRETAVETLEEDLETAQASISQSVSKEAESAKCAAELQAKVAEAQTQEAATRRRMEELQRQLQNLQAATLTSAPLGNAEQESLRRECAQLGIITGTPALLAMFRDLKKGARSTVTMLITGEPGTGKELFARAVHRLSPRSAKPFVAVNMAAISPELFESELFGHVRGSFTGALTDRKGYFELAHQGTIFLDEIGDLRLDHQSKLLRVLQDRTFYRVGATTPTTVDVRIVAATNKDLQLGVSEGWFREDLYFRLKGLVLHLPPLRERPDDIAALAGACLQEAKAQGAPATLSLSGEAVEALRQHPWQGNVRELRHCLEQAVALREGPVLGVGDLRLDVGTTRLQPGPVLPDPAGDLAVLQQLRQQRFDMQATAKALGWDRSTVTQRLKGLCFQALVEAGGDQAKAASALAGDPSLQRAVELKLMDYHGHLLNTIAPFTTVEDALRDCRRRFKNLPERHFKFVEVLVRGEFHMRGWPRMPR